LREVLKWEPQISLEEGLDRTYCWIADQLRGHVHSAAASTVAVTS